MATPTISYSHWQVGILKAVLRQKPKAVARVARCPNIYNMPQKVQFDEYSATLCQQNLPLATS